MNLLSLLHVRQANTAERLLRVQRFRYEIYVNELGKRLPTADHINKRLADLEDLGAVHFYCTTIFGAIVGSARLHFTPTIPPQVIADLGLNGFLQSYTSPSAYISRLMFQRGLRGKGAVLKLLAHIYCYGRQRGSVVCFNHCNPNLTRHYTRMGLHKFGKPFMDAYVGWQIPMVHILEDESHYHNLGSFLLKYCRQYPNDPNRIEYLREWFLGELAYQEAETTPAVGIV